MGDPAARDQSTTGPAEVRSVGWLVKQLIDDLDEDNRALYELIWKLNTAAPDLSEEEKLTRAQAAVAILLARDEYELHWFYWGLDGAPPREVPSMPSRQDWEAPGVGDAVLTLVNVADE